MPQYFRGKSITKINSRAFDANTSTTTVTIPASIVPESHAFNSGAVLKTVIFANGTTSIPQHLFHSCQNVTHVYIPDTVETIGAGALSDFSTVFTTYDGYAYNYAVNEGYSACGISGDSITHYSESTYANTYDIVLPSYFFGTEINTIYHQAFDGADDIVSIEIPNTVETIGRRAFRNCDLLRTVIIPPSVTSISNSMNSTIVEGSSNAVIFCRFGTYAYAYSQSTDATFVYMSIDDNTHTASVVGFKEGTGWSKELYIPETFMGYDVTSVGISAFNNSGSNGYNITKVYLPETVTSIGMRAFFSCDDLTYIYIPSAETTIGEVCFSPLVTNGLVVHCVLSSPAFVYAVTHNHSYQPI